MLMLKAMEGDCTDSDDDDGSSDYIADHAVSMALHLILQQLD